MLLNVTNKVDLHCHSTASDGTLAPAEVVRLAAENGVSGLALTDHDTIAGVAEAARTAEELGVDFLPGIEVSCAFPRPGTMHLLGYGFDAESGAMRELLGRIGGAREERASIILQRLGRLGMELSIDEVREQTPGAMIGRPHVADAMVRKGYAVSRRDAFDRFLGGGGAAYVDNHPLDAARVIELLREAGAFVSLAHPLQLRRRTPAQLDALVAELAEQGLHAIETHHGTHTTDTVHRLTRLADRLELGTTGGSDYYGPHRSGIRLGEAAGVGIPRRFFDDVAARVGAGAV